MLSKYTYINLPQEKKKAKKVIIKKKEKRKRQHEAIKTCVKTEKGGRYHLFALPVKKIFVVSLAN